MGRQNRKIIKNVIVANEGYIPTEKIKIIIGKYLFDMLLVILFPIFVIFIFAAIALFSAIRWEVISRVMGEIIIFIILISGALFAQQASRMNFKSVKAKYYILLAIENMYIMLGMSLYSDGYEEIMMLIKCVSYVGAMLVILYYNDIVLEGRYIDVIIRICECVRYGVLLLIFNHNILDKMQVGGPIIYVWISFTLFEYLYVLIKSKKQLEVKLHLQDDAVIDCIRVMQCNNDRIMYVTKKGQYRFIEKNEINFISYKDETYRLILKKVNKKKVCRLNDGTEIEYEDYWIDKNQWFTFTNTSNNVRTKCICHIDKIVEYG